MYESWMHGVHVGYLMLCGRHNNIDDADGVECRKFLTFGTGVAPRLSDEECRFRLKRWYILGAHGDVATWPADKKRTHHINIAGARCKHCASDEPAWSGISADDLNDMVAAIL